MVLPDLGGSFLKTQLPQQVSLGTASGSLNNTRIKQIQPVVVKHESVIVLSLVDSFEHLLVIIGHLWVIIDMLINHFFS